MLPEDRPQSCGLTPAQSSALVLRGSSSQRASPCWAQPAGSQKVLEAERLSLALLSSARVARLGPSSSPAPHPAAPGPCRRRRARRGAGRPSRRGRQQDNREPGPPTPRAERCLGSHPGLRVPAVSALHSVVPLVAAMKTFVLQQVK